MDNDRTSSAPRGLVAAGALLGAYAWGAVFLAADNFYATLDTAPSQVGLSANEVFAGVAGVLFTFAPFAFIAILLAIVLIRPRRWPARVGAAAFALVCFILLVGYSGRAFDLAITTPALTVLGAALLATSLLELSHRRITWAPLEEARRYLFVTACVTTTVTWVVLLACAPANARYLDRTGKATGVARILNPRARLVCIESLGPSVVPSLERVIGKPVLRLGEDRGVVVLRDRERRQTIHAPSGVLAIRTASDSHSC